MTPPTSERVVAGILLILTSLIPVPPSFVDFSTPAAERYVALSGGEFEGLTRTNSLEAIDRSYELGFRLIQLDFEWTTDGHLVLLHDWGRVFSENFLVLPGQRSLTALQGLPMRGALTPLTADSLLEWLDKHPEVLVLAYVRSSRLEAFRWIASTDAKAKERILPIIESTNDYDWIRELGYGRLVLSATDDGESARVIELARAKPLFAVVMSPERAQTGLARQLHLLNVRSYASPVNDPALVKSLREQGVGGFFTDRLAPAK